MENFVTFTALGYMGELGNQMFQVASTLGYAHKAGKKAIFPEWICKISGKDYRHIFKNPIEQSYSGQQLDGIINYDGLLYAELLPSAGNIDMRGYFQSEKYFEHISDQIKQTFKPNDEIRSYIETKYVDILDIENKVCLHIRTAKRSSNDYDVHSCATIEFIKEAQKNFNNDATYIVFADNMQEAKKILPADKKYIFIENEENYIDLFLMTYFDSYIISPSTFGWWGAWLSQNPAPKVSIKKDWFATDKPKAHLNNNHIIPDRWEKIYL